MDNKQKNILDVINALAIYKASEAGAIEKIPEPTLAGIKGAFLTDITQILEKFSHGEITANEVFQKIENYAKVAISSTIVFFTNKAVDITADFIKSRIPAINPIIEIGKNLIKNIVKSSVLDRISERISIRISKLQNKV